MSNFIAFDSQFFSIFPVAGFLSFWFPGLESYSMRATGLLVWGACSHNLFDLLGTMAEYQLGVIELGWSVFVEQTIPALLSVCTVSPPTSLLMSLIIYCPNRINITDYTYKEHLSWIGTQDPRITRRWLKPLCYTASRFYIRMFSIKIFDNFIGMFVGFLRILCFYYHFEISIKSYFCALWIKIWW